MSDTVDQVLDSVTAAATNEVVVIETEGTEVTEVTEGTEVVVEETAPVEETPLVTGEEEVSLVEEVEPSPVEEKEQVKENKPIEQVVNEIREILTEPVVEDNTSDELPDDLKQRIAELYYLCDCYGNRISSDRYYKYKSIQGKVDFSTVWNNRSVSIDPNLNYEDILVHLEKMPEIYELWKLTQLTNESNHFKDIKSYNLRESLFNGKDTSEKIKILEEFFTDYIN